MDLGEAVGGCEERSTGSCLRCSCLLLCYGELESQEQRFGWNPLIGKNVGMSGPVRCGILSELTAEVEIQGSNEG